MVYINVKYFAMTVGSLILLLRGRVHPHPLCGTPTPPTLRTIIYAHIHRTPKGAGVEKDPQNPKLCSPKVKIQHSVATKGASVTCQSSTSSSSKYVVMNINFGRHSFLFMNWTVRDLLCWQWFLILCKLPLFTFLPSSLMSNLYVLNSISRDCGSMRPIQSEKMDDAASMVWWVVKYRVGWLSWHYSYFNPSSRKALFRPVLSVRT